jgi:hypothetical protein
MNWFMSALLLAALGLAIGLPVVAWRARWSFTRLNYLGLAIGSAALGALSGVIASRGTDAPEIFGTISVLMLATSFGGFMAIFFYRKPLAQQERGSPNGTAGAVSIGTGRRSAKVVYFAVAGFLAVGTLGVLAFRNTRISHQDEPKPQLSSAELGRVKLDRTQIDDVGFLNGSIYNGSSWILTGLRIQINRLRRRRQNAIETSFFKGVQTEHVCPAGRIRRVHRQRWIHLETTPIVEVQNLGGDRNEAVALDRTTAWQSWRVHAARLL